jgi:hypothetical protein
VKWVTRRKARGDRIACPWLIRRFIDPQAEFLFVPEDEVMETARREGGFREVSRDDFERMALQLPVYDALYAYCRAARA